TLRSGYGDRARGSLSPWMTHPPVPSRSPDGIHAFGSGQEYVTSGGLAGAALALGAADAEALAVGGAGAGAPEAGGAGGASRTASGSLGAQPAQRAATRSTGATWASVEWSIRSRCNDEARAAASPSPKEVAVSLVGVW